MDNPLIFFLKCGIMKENFLHIVCYNGDFNNFDDITSYVMMNTKENHPKGWFFLVWASVYLINPSHPIAKTCKRAIIVIEQHLEIN